MPSAGKRLDANLSCTQDLSSSFKAEITKRESGNIIYLAPWAWDRYADPLRYRTVKAGIIALTQALAKRMAAARINVNCLVPGYIGDVKFSGTEGGKISEIMDHIPMGCLGDVPDIVKTAYFLISDSSKYLTGQVLEVAGGVD